VALLNPGDASKRLLQRFTPLLAEAARPCRHRVGDRWQVDETQAALAGGCW
jgi:IS6 family transposase